MAMRKSEMEECSAAYRDALAAADQSIRSGMYSTAVSRAISAWPYIDGMMQYARKYEEHEFKSISVIDVVLKYAPLLMDHASLDKVECLLKEFKRIDRNTDADLVADLADARVRMWKNHRLWEHVERQPDCRQNELAGVLGPDQDYWRSVAEAWEQMGLLHRTPNGGSYTLSLRTRLGQVVPGKCHNCGGVLEAPKAMLLEDARCPLCDRMSVFVVMG